MLYTDAPKNKCNIYTMKLHEKVKVVKDGETTTQFFLLLELDRVSIICNLWDYIKNLTIFSLEGHIRLLAFQSGS